MSDIQQGEIFVRSSRSSVTQDICRKIAGGEGRDWQLIGLINIYTTIHQRSDSMSIIGTHLSIINIDDRRNELPLLSSLLMIEGISEDFQLNQVGLCLTSVMDRKYIPSVCDVC